MREKGWAYRNIAVQYGVTSQRIRKVVEDYYDRQTKSANNLSLSTRAIHCLKRANIGINPYEIALNMVVLMNINGLGKRSLEEILQVLQSFNLLNP